MIKKFTACVFLLALSAAIYPGCVSPGRPAARSVAQDETQTDADYLAYYQYDPVTKAESVQVFSPETWSQLSEGHRYDLLTQMFYASTKGISNSNLYHLACFTGQADSVKEKFFLNSSFANSKTRVTNLEITFDRQIRNDALLQSQIEFGIGFAVFLSGAGDGDVVGGEGGRTQHERWDQC